jgi:hypothetical protein
MKCGGTSIDLLMSRLIRERQLIRRYIGHKHFDYSYIRSKGSPHINIDYITMLRCHIKRFMLIQNYQILIFSIILHF